MADADTVFQSDFAALPGWTFGREDAARITQPVLNAGGAHSAPYFKEIFETIRTWLPHAENYVVPDSSHAMLQINPQDIVTRLASFFSRHPLPE